MRGEFVAGSGFDHLSFGPSRVIPRFQVGNHIFGQCSAFAPFNVTQGCSVDSAFPVGQTCRSLNAGARGVISGNCYHPAFL